MTILKIRDYTLTPGLRTISQSDYSAEYFHNIIEKPFEYCIRDNDNFTIHLDGVLGYAYGFLDELFERLFKKYSREDIIHHLIIVSREEPDWIDEIYQKFIPQYCS
jgi:hypothetical protein